MIGLFQENGPCMVNVDSNSTTLNPWSWNNEVNMLFIDQPNQVGFSYDVPSNGTLDTITGDVTLMDFSDGVPEQNNTFYVGTFPTQGTTSTANDTQNSAKALWHFAQTWFQEFPAYKPNNNKISIFTESYGGRYGPAFAAFFEEQNERITNGTIQENGEEYIIHLDTLGIINGCIDLLTQELSYPQIAYKNTYGIQAINHTLYQQAIDNFNRPDTGCRDLILKCHAAADAGDPDFSGNNATVNSICDDASTYCSNFVEAQYVNSSGRNYYDFAAVDPDPFPPEYYEGFLAQSWVQRALGVPINFTESNPKVNDAFVATGDYARADIRGGYLADIAYLLDNGVKVALMYGDRDYACNWLGGETASLAVNYSETKAFSSAGYADIVVNDSYSGGVVRQHGNFSFSRVFAAGHEVPAYQPEAAYRIFSRAVFGMDIATGNIDVSNSGNANDYSTSGPSDSFSIKNEVPESPTPQCYILSLTATCTEEQQQAVINGSGLIHDYILIDRNQSNLFPGISPNASIGNGMSNSTGSAGGTNNLTTSSGAPIPGPSSFTSDSSYLGIGHSLVIIAICVSIGTSIAL